MTEGTEVYLAKCGEQSDEAVIFFGSQYKIRIRPAEQRTVSRLEEIIAFFGKNKK